MNTPAIEKNKKIKKETFFFVFAFFNKDVDQRERERESERNKTQIKDIKTMIGGRIKK